MKLILLVGLMAVACPKVFSQSFVNASLEQWGDTNICEINSPPDGWSDYSNGGIGLDEADFNICPTTTPPNASEGNVYARAYAVQNSGEGIYQNISGFTIGNAYQFSFDYAGSNLYPGTNYIRWHVFIDDIEVDSTPMFQSTDDFWTTHVTTFTATANTHKIGFRLYIDSLIFDSGSGGIDNFILELDAQPNANIQPTVTKLCPEDCISFGNTSTNATSFEWFFSGATPDYSTDQFPTSICYATSGFYDVTLIAHNGTNSDTMTINSLIEVYTSPSPIITASNDTLICTNAPNNSTYQWYFDNDIIAGATDSVYVAGTSGLYSVVVTNADECTGSDSLQMKISGITEIQNQTFELFPNPADESVTVSLTNHQPTTIELYNTLGQLIKNGLVESQTTIDLSKLSSGLYYISIQTKNDLVTRRLIVSHR